MKSKALVVGLARSGIAAASLLLAEGYAVKLSDQKPLSALESVLEPVMGQPDVTRCLGVPPETQLDDVQLVVVSPGVPLTNPVFEAARARHLEVIGELELAYRFAHGRLIAITGTNGKTTTTTLTGEIFKNAGKRTFVVGNIGFPYAAVALETKPEDVTVCEVSSFQLETVDRFHPEISAILNITEDHLNRHGTMENYIAHKARVFRRQTEKDSVVLNYDDEALRAMALQAHCAVRWFSRTQTPPFGAFVQDGMLMYGAPGDARNICPVEEILIPGPHNLENALAATAMAMAAGVPAPVIRHTLRTFQGVEHRLEFVREVDGVRYINDSKGTNVDSTLKAVDTMRAPTVLIAGGSTKKADMMPLARAIDAGMITHVVLIGDTADDIENALRAVGYTAFERAGYDFERALTLARSRAVPGGNVLLSPACASFDMFRDYEERGEVFKSLVHALICGA